MRPVAWLLRVYFGRNTSFEGYFPDFAAKVEGRYTHSVLCIYLIFEGLALELEGILAQNVTVCTSLEWCLGKPQLCFLCTRCA